MIFLTKAWKPASCLHSERKRGGIAWKKLFLFFFPACSVQPRSWLLFIWSGRSRLDLRGCPWLQTCCCTHGSPITDAAGPLDIRKYLYMASGFSRRPMCSSPKPQKNPSSACASRRPPSVRSFFLVPVFFISLSGGIAGGKNALNAVCVPQAVPQNNCKTALKSAYQMVSAFHSGREIRTLDTTGMNRML